MAKRNRRERDAEVRFWQTSWFWALFGFGVIAALTYGQWWLSQNAHLVTDGKDFSKIGNLGDSFGIVNALISGMAFVALVITLVLQSRELQLQREELADTRKELRGSRHAQEMQVQMALQSARITSLSAILNHKFHQYTYQPNLRRYIDIELNRWNAELEAEIASLHFAQQPLQAANSMLHSAVTEISFGTRAAQPVLFPLQLPADLPGTLDAAITEVEQLLDASHSLNSTVSGQPTNDDSDPLKPVVRAWLLKARERLLLAKQEEEQREKEELD